MFQSHSEKGKWISCHHLGVDGIYTIVHIDW